MDTFEFEELINKFKSYFPQKVLNESLGEYDQYIFDLIKTIKDNFKTDNYQVAFFYLHLLFMSYVYYSVEKIIKYEKVRADDVYSSMRPYSNGDKPCLDNYDTIYKFSKLPEKEILNLFRCVNMDNNDVSKIKSYIKSRDNIAHATGDTNIDLDELLSKLDNILIHMSKIQNSFDVYIRERYLKFLEKNCFCKYKKVEELFFLFLNENSLSKEEWKRLATTAISSKKEISAEYSRNYQSIRNLHCAIIDFYENSDYLDFFVETHFDQYRKTIDYYFYKYKDNANGYIEDVLGLDKYSTVKDGGEWPLYTCHNCDTENLVLDTENHRYICFDCEKIWEADKIEFCSECNAPYEVTSEEDLGICYSCLEEKCNNDD